MVSADLPQIADPQERILAEILLFDDAFAYTDPERIQSLQRMLDLAATRGLQIIVLTCTQRLLRLQSQRNPADFHVILAMYDPDITLPNCATDRSLSIAHDLESTFWEEILADKLPKSKAGRAPKKPAKKKAKAPTEDETYSLGDGNDDGSDANAEASAETTTTGKWRPKQVLTVRPPPSPKHRGDCLNLGDTQPFCIIFPCNPLQGDLEKARCSEWHPNSVPWRPG